MKVIRVQYTTRAEYAAINKKNIEAIVRELRALNNPHIKYTAWVLADGKTFMHFDQFADEEAHLVLQGLASFKKFASELHAGGLEVEPELELLDVVASTEHYF